MERLTTLTALIVCGISFGADPAVPERVDFERHVVGLLSKTGCNAGNCHGSFQGKNGFRLSLFGYEPAMDHHSLTRDNLGRRINLHNPDDSLILQKAVGRTLHEGGMRFGNGSWNYNVLRRWIEQGGTWNKGSGAIAELNITPADFLIINEGETKPMTVMATFTDGSKEDITAFCDFKVSDDAVASISPLGAVTAIRPGDAALTVLYRGTVRAIRVLVPVPGSQPFPDLKPTNPIDREVFAKLKLLNMHPAGPASDTEFLRRATIDTIGILPTPDEVRTFLASTDPDKKKKKIDELLKHPLHAAVWATKFDDITGNNTENLEAPVDLRFKRSQLWHDWLRKRIQDNVPYDQMVRQILTATSLDDMTPEAWAAMMMAIDKEPNHGFGSKYAEKKSLDLFWRRNQAPPIETWGEKVAAAFLGVRLECAQCHKHPTDRWTQEDYWSFANIYSQLAFPAFNQGKPENTQYSSVAVKAAIEKENLARREAMNGKNNAQINYIRELYVAPGAFKGKPMPGAAKVLPPKALGGPALEIKPGEDPRAKLADWLLDKSNPYFARSFVNRVWAHYTGLGIVNPVDDFSQANPPTNPRLLDALAQSFIESGYDLRKLETMIMNSQTYQMSAATNDTNKHDKNNYSHAYIRPLSAEQVIDVVNTALGVDEDFGKNANLPAGTKMSEIGATLLGGTAGPANNNPQLGYILRIFGRPGRTTACDCERIAEPALPQKLYLMTDASLLAKLGSPNGRVAKLAKAKLEDAQAAEELFLATLGRLPNDKEKSAALEHLGKVSNKAEALADMLWALMNTREFILNH